MNASGRIALGMSGGVDSAVSAALLMRAGYEVVGGMNWQAYPALGESYDAMVKLRYRSRPCACIIEPEDDQRVSLALRSPQPTTAPGQYAVLYDGDTVLGGGMIEEVMHA